MHLTSHITHSNGYVPYIAYYRSNGVDQLFRKLKPKQKLNPPNAHRSQIKICENRQTQNVQFPFMPNAFECFVTQVQTRLPKTKCVWPMKINVICTVLHACVMVILCNTICPERKCVHVILSCTLADPPPPPWDFRGESSCTWNNNLYLFKTSDKWL